MARGVELISEMALIENSIPWPYDRDARTRELHDNRDRLNERPTHEDDRGNSGDMQRDSYHTGMNSSMSRSFSSPKVPTFDGTISAQFRPWIIQFEAIASHQVWTQGERVEVWSLH